MGTSKDCHEKPFRDIGRYRLLKIHKTTERCIIGVGKVRLGSVWYGYKDRKENSIFIVQKT